MPSFAPFLHLDALRAVLAGSPSLETTGGRHPLPLPYVTGGALLWPQEHAHRVLHEWALWTRSVPADVSSAGRLLRFPRSARLPGTLSGRALVAIEVAIPREPWVAEGRLAALRRLQPEIDTVALTSTAGVPALHGTLELPAGATGRHAALRGLNADAVDAFVEAAGPASGSPLASAELRHAGGAYALSASGRAAGEDEASRLETWLDIVFERLSPHAAAPRSPRVAALAA